MLAGQTSWEFRLFLAGDGAPESPPQMPSIDFPFVT
jgi:hypothetical protein